MSLLNEEDGLSEECYQPSRPTHSRNPGVILSFFSQPPYPGSLVSTSTLSVNLTFPVQVLRYLT